MLNLKLSKVAAKRRIAAGSGTQIQDVNKLLKQFTQMQKMMKKMSGKGGMRKMMSSIARHVTSRYGRHG